MRGGDFGRRIKFIKFIDRGKLLADSKRCSGESISAL